ncbi:MAG: NfeD family protein [Planctomycetota bacterium]
MMTLGLLALIWATGSAQTQPATAPATATAPRLETMPTEPLVPPPPPRVPLPSLPEEVTQAFVIPIEGMIGQATTDAVERKIAHAKAQGAKLIIFEFNTPGGLVKAAQQITNLIRTELRDVRTVAFVNPDAISAGAWLALNAHEIVMVPHAKIGDSAPVTMGGELPDVQREKMESYLRSDFRTAAEAHGYWPVLAEAMVSRDMEVWLIENTVTGERRYVERSEWLDASEDLPDTLRTDRENWRRLRVVVAEGKLLTATTSEAVELGFVEAVVPDRAGLLAHYNVVGEPTVLADTWSERIVAFLTSPAVTGILVMLAMFFGYMELQTPGFGIGGILALICLAVLFGSRFLTGLAQWWEIAVFVVGVALVLIEIFVIPGVGVVGLLGGIMCLVGLLAILIANPPGELPIPSPGLIMDRFLDGLLALTLGFLGGVVLCAILARYLPHIPVAGRLVLAETPVGETLPYDSAAPIRRIQPGARGVTETYCRPAGKARFDDDLVDVVTEGGVLPAGTTVVVQRNLGNRLVVAPAEPTA